jgi:pimeloyl-ACP methyl ester carboxylesterase
MARLPIVVSLVFVLQGAARLAAGQPVPCPSSIPFGQNPKAGHMATVNGIRMYYESYGKGQPLLLIHGNGGFIAAWRCQILYFSRSYRVIVADNRAHGRTDDGTGPLTYEQMADDLAAMLDQAKAGPVDIIGHSDGGILGLLIAIRHPSQVKKLVASGPNLRPDATALVDWFVPSTEKIAKEAEAMMAKDDRSKNWRRIRRQNELMLNEPHIPLADLRRIEAPTLILGADDDMIRLEHFVEIYRNVPKSHLAILPGATHLVPTQQPEIYNAFAERFLKQPFVRPTTKQAFGVQ